MPRLHRVRRLINMKIYRFWTVLVVVLAMMVLFPGCSSISTRGGSGAGHSPIEYSGNTLQVSDNLPLNLELDAAKVALAALQIPVVVDKKNTRSVRIEGRDAKSQPVIIQLLGINHYTTEVQITVGTTNSAEHRAEEQLIYDKMRNS